MNTLGKRVEEARKRLGMSQAELAERAGISQTTLSDIERGRNDRSRYAVNLSEALCVDPVWLVGGKENNPVSKYESRRLALIDLVDSLGRGGVSHVAEMIGKDASYVSRMLYPEDKSGFKRIGEDTVEAITAAFPDWLDGNKADGHEDASQYLRLLEAAETLQGWTTPARIAAMLTESGYPTSSQTLCNWKSRGLSFEAILKCSRIIGCDPLWLEDGSVAIEPNARSFKPTSATTFESIASICLTLTQDQREQVLKFAQFVSGDHP